MAPLGLLATLCNDGAGTRSSVPGMLCGLIENGAAEDLLTWIVGRFGLFMDANVAVA